MRLERAVLTILSDNMISKKQVQHIAKLAKLPLSEEETIKFQKQLSDVLDYIAILEELDTEKAERTSQVTGLENVYRDDEIGASLSGEEAFLGVESRDKGYFKTKRILQHKWF